MRTIIGIAIALFLVSLFPYLLWRWGASMVEAELELDRLEDGPENDIFAKNDIDEFAPENIITDEMIKTASLRNKLQKIESKRKTK